MKLPVRSLLAPTFVALVGGAAALAPRTQEPQFKIHTVAGPVAYLEGAGGNIGLFRSDGGMLVIDTQLERFREGVVGAIDRHADGAPIRYLLNTHWHGDHTGNNEPIGSRSVPILAHDAVRARLVGGAGVEGRTGQNTPASALPTVTYEEGIELHLGDEEIAVRHYGPGHTDGDSVVFFTTSKVVHLGDLFFKDRFPFIDAGSGGSPSGYVKAVATVLSEIDDEWKVIPGHGDLATRADLQRFHDVVANCIDRVRAGMAEGKSVETMQKEGIFASYSGWGEGFISADRFVADLEAGLRAEAK